MYLHVLSTFDLDLDGRLLVKVATLKHVLPHQALIRASLLSGVPDSAILFAAVGVIESVHHQQALKPTPCLRMALPSTCLLQQHSACCPRPDPML